MIIYKVKSEVMRIGKHKGKTMYYASPVVHDRISTEQVEERIVNLTALSRADVRSAIAALAEIVREEMFNGRLVDLADLGSFKVVSTSKYVENENEVRVESLKTPQIKFYPKEEMLLKAKKVERSIMRDE